LTAEKLAHVTSLYYSPPVRVDTLGGNADEAHRMVPFSLMQRFRC